MYAARKARSRIPHNAVRVSRTRTANLSVGKLVTSNIPTSFTPSSTSLERLGTRFKHFFFFLLLYSIVPSTLATTFFVFLLLRLSSLYIEVEARWLYRIFHLSRGKIPRSGTKVDNKFKLRDRKYSTGALAHAPFFFLRRFFLLTEFFHRVE